MGAEFNPRMDTDIHGIFMDSLGAWGEAFGSASWVRRHWYSARMGDMKRPAVGSVAWRDLTVPDAAVIRDFYSRVVGWEAQPLDMGGYADFNMIMPGSTEPQAGICHARGGNAGLPAQWLMYIVVEDLERSLAECAALGGSIVSGPRQAGGARYCVVKDPAGAVCALYQLAPADSRTDGKA